MEDLEWEVFKGRGVIKFSNGNKNIKNCSGSGASIKLKNKTIKSDREYNITIKNEIKDDKWLRVGVCDCGNWEKSIFYDHRNGNIYDNHNVIKELKEILKLNDSLVIKDMCVAKLNNNKYVYFVSMFKNGDEIFTSYYSEENRKTLFLQIDPQVEVEVDVKGKNSNKN